MSQPLPATTTRKVREEVVPINWPSDIQYLRRPTHSAAIPVTTLETLNKPTKATATFAKISIASISSPNPAVQIHAIKNPSHPAYPEAGLFAAQHLPPNSLILPYIGHLHTSSDADSTSSYDVSLDRDLDISVDAAKAGNEARFVNDYRGIKDKPNAEFRDLWVRVGEKKWERGIAIFVLTPGKAGFRKAGIKMGEEILVSYGKGFWKERRGEDGATAAEVETEVGLEVEAEEGAEQD